MIDVRDARQDDRARVAAMLARAFAEDPAMAYIFPDSADRATRLPKLFALLFDEDAGGMRLIDAERTAATLWRAPGAAVTPWWGIVRHAIPLLAALGPALPRALRLSHAIEAHFPLGRFWYLHIAGVDPSRQGRGLGGALIRAGLARCDAEGMPAYLETATESNVGLYRAIGFDLVGEWTVPGGGPRFWSMRRG